jgi:hypothetical protein
MKEEPIGWRAAAVSMLIILAEHLPFRKEHYINQTDREKLSLKVLKMLKVLTPPELAHLAWGQTRRPGPGGGSTPSGPIFSSL